jgi:hypothetical protein
MTPGTQLLPMISMEVDAHAVRLNALADELGLTLRLFDGVETCLMLDTSFYIEHAEKIEEVDFHALAQLSGPVRVLIPIIVVDELDGLKKSRDSRWRAGYSLAVIDRVITSPPLAGHSQCGDTPARIATGRGHVPNRARPSRARADVYQR